MSAKVAFIIAALLWGAVICLLNALFYGCHPVKELPTNNQAPNWNWQPPLPKA